MQRRRKLGSIKHKNNQCVQYTGIFISHANPYARTPTSVVWSFHIRTSAQRAEHTSSGKWIKKLISWLRFPQWQRQQIAHGCTNPFPCSDPRVLPGAFWHHFPVLVGHFALYRIWIGATIRSSYETEYEHSGLALVALTNVRSWGQFRTSTCRKIRHITKKKLKFVLMYLRKKLLLLVHLAGSWQF